MPCANFAQKFSTTSVELLMYLKLCFIFCLSLFFAPWAKAQTTLNHTFWLRTNFVYAHHDQKYIIESACRQVENMPLLRGIRTWVQIPVHKHWHWEMSPIAWFMMYQKPNPTENGFIVKHEWRTAQYATYKTNFRRVEWQNRTGAEARYDRATKQITWHFREKITGQYAINDSWTLGVFDELFLPFQHRIGAFLQLHLLQKSLTMEAGGFYWQRAQEPTQNCACTITFQYKYQHSKK
jgi:hypothetical protein